MLFLLRHYRFAFARVDFDFFICYLQDMQKKQVKGVAFAQPKGVVSVVPSDAEVPSPPGVPSTVAVPPLAGTRVLEAEAAKEEEPVAAWVTKAQNAGNAAQTEDKAPSPDRAGPEA